MQKMKNLHYFILGMEVFISEIQNLLKLCRIEKCEKTFNFVILFPNKVAKHNINIHLINGGLRQI